MRLISLVLFLCCGLSYGRTEDSQKIIRLVQYRPTFMAVNDQSTRMQFSFKMRLLKKYQLYLAYTQYTFWKPFEPSSPFYDISHCPDFFYSFKLEEGSENSLDLGLWDHRSNGVDDANSRSWDRSYIRYNFHFSRSGYTLKLVPRLYNINMTSENNTDIRDFLGYGDLRMTLSLAPGNSLLDNELQVNWVPSKRFDKGALDVGLSLRKPTSQFKPYFFFFFFHGYGEDILGYNQKSSSLRIGLRI